MQKRVVHVFLMGLFLFAPGVTFAQVEGEGNDTSILLRLFVEPLKRVVDEIGSYIAAQPTTGMLAGVSYTGPLCPASTVDGILGIGDGCSLEYKGFDLSYIPDIGLFKGTFTNACNNHDKCYTTLGRTVSECNTTFLSEMKSACDDKFNKYLRPVERNACRRSADLYKEGVDRFASQADPMPEMQGAAYAESMRLKTAYESGLCVTNPERTTLYAPSLISQINDEFITYTGRKPTMSEFLRVLHLYGWKEFPGYFVSHREYWNSYLKEFAQLRKVYTPPEMPGWYRDMEYIKVQNPQPGVTYEWVLSGYPRTQGTSLVLITNEMENEQDKYDSSKLVKGYLRAVQKGVSVETLIETRVFLIGWCSSGPSQPCRESVMD